MRDGVLVYIKDKTRSWYFKETNELPVRQHRAKQCKGVKGRYVGRKGVQMDNSSGGKCELVLVFENLYYCPF